MTLTEFLLARIAEDEAVTHNASGNQLRAGYSLMVSGRLMVHPARVRAECEAKRRIVATHQLETWAPGSSGTPHCSTCADWENADHDGPPEIAWPCPTMRLLALPYADHPDFDEAWRV